jgi:polysaccharide export outer membrane protein
MPARLGRRAWPGRFPLAGVLLLALGCLAATGDSRAQVLDARGATGAGDGPMQAAPAPGYRLRPGDRLRITVFGHPDLSGAFDLDAAGRIAFPLIGQVDLAGRTPRAAERALVDRLKPDYLRQPHVGLQVLNLRPVYILGEVETPGSYAYRSGLTVMEAVALAGGFSFRADPDDIAISRARDDGRRRRQAAPDTRVLPGDTVYVDSRLF